MEDGSKKEPPEKTNNPPFSKESEGLRVGATFSIAQDRI